MLLNPVINELTTEYDGTIQFAKVDVDKSSKIASKYKIMSLPTIIIIKNNNIINKIVGFKSKADIKKTIFLSNITKD
jgi:thioredoxin 1